MVLLPARGIFLFSIGIGFAQASELNVNFLRGVSGIPSVFKTDISYPSGEYLVEVLINGVRTGRVPLSIDRVEEKADMLCLSPEWLRNAGVFFKLESYQGVFDSVRGCYLLAAEPYTRTEFDYGAQSLDFVIPQAYLLDKNDAALWDYGVSGFRLTYNSNFSKTTDHSLNAFGSFNASLNLGSWVLTSNMNTSYNAEQFETQVSDITLSRAISSIQGDLLLGRSQTRTELFNDFSFYGLALRSNSSMRPWRESGYAPIISGVASGTSRITITQSGYTIFSTVVPPGPYTLEDINPTGNGNLVMTVEDEAGQKTVSEYSVATLPTLLRPGVANYNVAIGQKSDSALAKDAFSSGQGVFLLGSYDYGFSFITLNLASILNNGYQAGGIGTTLPLAKWGAVSANLNVSKAHYNSGERKLGGSVAFKYAKNFGERTDLQLLTWRYQTQGYTEYADFRPESSNAFEREKARYEARLSHRFDKLYLSASYWQQSYWDQPSNTSGLNVSGSTSLGRASIFLSGNHTQNAWDRQSDYSVSLSVSIPFTLGGAPYFSSSSVGYNRNSGSTFNTGVSANINDRFNYRLNAGSSAQGRANVSASASYAFDSIQTNVQLSQNRHQTTVSGNVSGSAIVTEKTGVMFTKQSSDTLAVVKIKNMPGITFNHSLPTNHRGETVVNMSSYVPSSININMDNVPDHVELLDTSFNVLPTERAIIYREFDVKHVLRYILRLKDNRGNNITGGSAETEQKLDAGFVANNGVLLMNMLSAPKTITVTKANGQQCSFSVNHLKANTGAVQEVRCE